MMRVLLSFRRSSRRAGAARLGLTFLTLWASSVRAAPGDQEPLALQEPSAVYWHSALGLGGWLATSNYVDSGRPGTRGLQGLSLNLVSTLAYRASRLVAVGLHVSAHFFPVLRITEDRRRGFREVPVTFGIAGTVGPSLTLLPGRVRFELSPGFLWVVGAGATFGGIGPGLTLGVGVDFEVGRGVELTVDLRGTGGAHFNGDSTHTFGLDAAATLLVGLRSR